MSPQIPTKKLSNGLEMPVVGLGTFEAKEPEVLKAAIRTAVTAGYRHFDCAYIYKNEATVGQALHEIIAESNGALKREDFFIVSKVWGTFHSKERVAESLNMILESLGFDYIDILLMHSPMGYKEDSDTDLPFGADGKLIPSDVHYTDTYKAMEALVATGKVKSIGLSNFNVEQAQNILHMCKIKPVCNQVEISPTCRNEELVEFCLGKHVLPVAYTPLGAPCRVQSGEPNILELPLIVNLAKKYNKTPAQVVLRWLLQRDIAVIPKSVTPDRIKSNLDLFDFKLTDEEKDEFNKLPVKRFITYQFVDTHPHFPFH